MDESWFSRLAQNEAHMKNFFLFLVLLLVPTIAHADVFDAPCSRYRVPKPLVLAIAKTESGLDPWCVNVAGKDYRPGSRDGALAIIRQARARGLSHDIGLMQINSWWLKHLGISPEAALEPRNNATLGVWILAKEIQRHGYNWKAVGAYHSPTPARQKMYAQVVFQKYRNLK